MRACRARDSGSNPGERLAFNQAAAGSIPVGPVLILYLTFLAGGKNLKVDIQQHDLVPKHEVISESEKKLLQQNSDFDVNNLPKIKITDPVVKELISNGSEISAGDVLRITRNSKTAGEFVSYRIVIEG